MRERKIWLFAHNCNSGVTYTNKKRKFGSIECWFNKEGIANIISIPKLEETRFHITYYIRDGRYIVHTKDEEIQSNKEEMGLLYMDANKSQDTAFVKTFQENFECFQQVRDIHIQTRS